VHPQRDTEPRSEYLFELFSSREKQYKMLDARRGRGDVELHTLALRLHALQAPLRHPNASNT
jgi:hypothetical protein